MIKNVQHLGNVLEAIKNDYYSGKDSFKVAFSKVKNSNDFACIYSSLDGIVVYYSSDIIDTIGQFDELNDSLDGTITLIEV